MQVALDAAAFGVGGVDHACAAGGQRLDAVRQRVGAGGLQQGSRHGEVHGRGAAGQPRCHQDQRHAEQHEGDREMRLVQDQRQRDERGADQTTGDDQGRRCRGERAAEGVVARLPPDGLGGGLPYPTEHAGLDAAARRVRHQVHAEHGAEPGPLPRGEPGRQRVQGEQRRAEQDESREHVHDLLMPVAVHDPDDLRTRDRDAERQVRRYQPEQPAGDQVRHGEPGAARPQGGRHGTPSRCRSVRHNAKVTAPACRPPCTPHPGATCT